MLLIKIEGETERPLQLLYFAEFIMLIDVYIKYWHTGGTIIYQQLTVLF